MKRFSISMSISVGGVLVLLGIVGWVMNIVKIFYLAHGIVTTMLIVRIIGVFVAPMGSILGWF